MTPEFFRAHALRPALTLLPAKLDTPPARAQTVAICLQESQLLHRRQIGGPARSYAQFEHGGGVRGVLTHPASRPLIRPVLDALDYGEDADAVTCFQAIEHNDVLCAAFARLLLYTLPEPLPRRDQPATAWRQYLKAWRPAKPHAETWAECYDRAWALEDQNA